MEEEWGELAPSNRTQSTQQDQLLKPWQEPVSSNRVPCEIKVFKRSVFLLVGQLTKMTNKQCYRILK